MKFHIDNSAARIHMCCDCVATTTTTSKILRYSYHVSTPYIHSFRAMLYIYYYRHHSVAHRCSVFGQKMVQCPMGDKVC